MQWRYFIQWNLFGYDVFLFKHKHGLNQNCYMQEAVFIHAKPLHAIVSSCLSQYLVFKVDHQTMSINRRSSVIGWNHYRKEHLSYSFGADYRENNPWCTLQNGERSIHVKGFVKETSITKHPKKLERQRAELRTKINLAPIHMRLGEGNGSNNRPTA